MSCESVELTIEVDIFATSQMSPVLGLLSEREQTGFLWDRTLITSNVIEQFSYNTYTGSMDFKLREGTQIEDWQSGTFDDLKYLALSSIYQPLVKIGNYSISSSIRTLYSDYSYLSYVSNLNNDSEDRNTHQLPDEARMNTIGIYSLRRDDRLLNVLVDEFIQVEEFSDDTYKNEYIVSEELLVTLDADYVRKRALKPDTLTAEEIRDCAFFAGNGNDASRDFFITYFPIIPDTIESYIIYEDETVEQWTFVDNFNFSFEEDKHLVLNSDLGVVSCGGAKPDTLVLIEDISVTDTEIEFYTTRDIGSYPTIGIVHIDSETIAFTSRSHNKLLNCTRGYNGTINTNHSIGSQIVFEQRGMPIPIDAELWIYYESTLRIECEVTDSNIRTGTVDCRPSKNSTSSKIVQISSKLKDLDRLVLEADKPLLGLNSYGPIFFGNDISKLTVTAYDSLDNPVDDLLITLEILDPIIGLLDGESTSVIKNSNSEGKIFAYYNTPIDAEEFSSKFDSLQYSSGSTIFSIDNLAAGTTLEDIFIFQLFKQDPSIGSSGVKYPIKIYQSTTTKPGADFQVTLYSNLDDSYDNGIAYFMMNDSTVETRSIVQGSGNKLYCSGGDLPSIASFVWLLSSEDVEWDPDLLNGIPVIIYVFDPEVQHPVSGLDGAYAPIKPSSIVNGIISYSYILPEPEPTDRNSNLGAYLIVAPVNVSFRASAVDPFSGDTIYSNIITLTIKLPNYLTGVDYSGALPVPKGFNFILDSENVGNGIGLANFITINHKSDIFGLQLKFAS